MKYRISQGSEVTLLDVELTSAGLVVTSDSGERQLLRVEERADGSHRVVTPWGVEEVRFVRRKGELWARASGRRLHAAVERARPLAGSESDPERAGQVHSPMAGKLVRLLVSLGEEVRAGQALAVIEAMKMENELLSPIDGRVAELPVTAPGAVDKGALIARVSDPAAPSRRAADNPPRSGRA